MAVVLCKDTANVCRSSILIVSCSLHDQCHATRRISFVNELLYGATGDLAGSLLDGSLYRVIRHVLRPGSQNSRPKPGIHIDVAASRSGCDHDFLREPAKNLSALCV